MEEMIQQIRTAGLELRPGLTEAELTAFQKDLGAQLPVDLSSLYADHDGMLRAPELPMRMLTHVESVRDTSAVRTQTDGLLDATAALFWSDDNSNYAGVYLDGLLANRVFLLDHEEPDPTPRFFDVRSFTQRLLAHPGDLIGNDVRDYPAMRELGPTAAEDRRLGLDFLRAHAANPEDAQSAFLALALLPPEDTHLLIPLLASQDMWVQERACVVLGKRRSTEATQPLLDVARGGQHNGQIAAILALKRIGASEVEAALRSLETQLGPTFSPYFRRKLP